MVRQSTKRRGGLRRLVVRCCEEKNKGRESYRRPTTLTLRHAVTSIPRHRPRLCDRSAAFFAPVRTNSFVAQQRASTRASTPLRLADPELAEKVGFMRDNCQGVEL